MKLIDRFLNAITMYKLVLYGLTVLSMISIAFGFAGVLPYDGISLAFTLGILIAVCYVSNFLFSKIFLAATNSESYYITANILFFILAPVTNMTDVWITIAAGIIAMGSKYLLSIDRKHIFNPAAIAVFILGLCGFGNGIWWVGSGALLPFVAILGLLVVRKIRRFFLLYSFLFTAIVTICLVNVQNDVAIQDSFIQSFTSWPLIFFGTIMLTEPLTTPPRKKLAMMYGALVGVLFGLQFHFGPLHATPEFALLVGNIFSYIVSPKKKLFLNLQSTKQLAPTIYEFAFRKNTTFDYLPGQYLEWTVPHSGVDLRGNRRYFTIASSPTEKEIKLGVKIDPEHASSYKKALLSMKPGGEVIGAQLTGDFVLPKDETKKLVFIAGGIGITPFRSILHSLIDTNTKRDIVLFYACSTASEFVYKDIFAKASEQLGIKIVYVLTHAEDAPTDWQGEKGRLNADMLAKYVPDVKDRMYYISGPNTMVDAYKKVLHEVGVSRGHIITDYFPGY